MDFAGAAVQKSGGIGLSLRQIHELHYPLVTGHLNILAQQDVADPHQGIEPVEHQGQKANELDPVIPLVQVGALVGQNLLPGVVADPGGNVDFRLQKAQHKGRFQPLALPAAPDLPGILHLAAQMGIGDEACTQQRNRHNAPQRHEVGLQRFRLGQANGWGL